MTTQTFLNGRTGGGANNPPPGAVEYARVIDGQLHLRIGGRLVPSTGWDATMVLLGLWGSPYPESQERARQIRAALKETMQ